MQVPGQKVQGESETRKDLRIMCQELGKTLISIGHLSPQRDCRVHWKQNQRSDSPLYWPENTRGNAWHSGKHVKSRIN